MIRSSMTNLRRKRLLLLSKTVNADHKAWYSQYCVLIGEGLVKWCLGTAFLTEKGELWLKEKGGE